MSVFTSFEALVLDESRSLDLTSIGKICNEFCSNGEVEHVLLNIVFSIHSRFNTITAASAVIAMENWWMVLRNR